MKRHEAVKMCRLVLMALVTAVMCAAPALRAATPSDPWAAGASVDPWPLIERLQGWGVGSRPEPEWKVAVAHGDPLVRAAAAAAMGRTARPEQRTLLERLLADRVRLVRRTAQWAALRMGDTIPATLADDALRDRRVEYYGRTEADPGVISLLARWVPQTVIQGAPALRRAWLRKRAGGPLSPLEPQASCSPAALTGGWVTAARSEWDADEIVELAARVVAGPAKHPGGVDLARLLVPLDPYRPPGHPSGQRSSLEPPGPQVTVRVVGGDGTGRLQLPSSSDRLVRLAFDLEELPPDVYTLRFGNPLFLRVRRSTAMEKRAAAAVADVLTSTEALDDVARLRALDAAPALRKRVEQSIAAYGFGFNAYRDALVLARLPDRSAAELVLPPLIASAALNDPWTGRRPDLDQLFRTGFGGQARDVLLPLLADWRRALQLGWGDALVRILGDRDWTGVPALDAARLDVLAELPRGGGPVSGIPPMEYHERNLLQAVLTAAAADYPQESGASLARVPRGGELTGLLRMVASGLSTAETERLVHATWAALAGAGPEGEEVRSALVKEASVLGVPLPAGSQPR